MKISTKAASVRHAASKDATRHNLNCVLVEDDAAIAADGHMLLWARPVGAEAGERACLGLGELEAERKVAKARKAGAVEVVPSEDVLPGDYPNWRAVVPEPFGTLPVADDAKVVVLDACLLEKLLKAAREFHSGKSTDSLLLRFMVQGETDPVLVEVLAPYDGEMLGVVMPVKP